MHLHHASVVSSCEVHAGVSRSCEVRSWRCGDASALCVRQGVLGSDRLRYAMVCCSSADVCNASPPAACWALKVKDLFVGARHTCLRQDTIAFLGQDTILSYTLTWNIAEEDWVDKDFTPVKVEYRLQVQDDDAVSKSLSGRTLCSKSGPSGHCLIYSPGQSDPTSLSGCRSDANRQKGVYVSECAFIATVWHAKG